MKTFTRIWIGIGLLAIGIGICLVLIAIGNGARLADFSYTSDDIHTVSMDESYTGVNSLDFNISYGEVTLEEGDSFHIKADKLPENELTSYVENGTWMIKENKDADIDIFGINISRGALNHWDNNLTPKITITVPTGFIAENLTLDVGAGDVKADTLSTKNGSFTVNAGKFEVNHLQVSGDSEYNIGAGDMLLKDLQADNISVDCGVGNVSIDGVIKGDNSVSVGVGKAELNLTGNEQDYAYQIDSGIGNVIINGESYHDTKKHQAGYESAQNRFSLDCGIGNITIDYK